MLNQSSILGLLCLPQVWAEEAVGQAPSGDLVLMGHRTWGPIDDIRVLLITSQNEVQNPSTLIEEMH